MEVTKSAIVRINVYDMSTLNDPSWSSTIVSSIFKSVSSGSEIPHLSIVVFGNEYSYSAEGVSSKEPSNEFKSSIDYGETLKTRNDLESFIDELKEKNFKAHNYNVLTHNCITFANELTMFLMSKNVPDEYLNAPENLIKTGIKAGATAVDAVYQMMGGDEAFDKKKKNPGEHSDEQK